MADGPHHSIGEVLSLLKEEHPDVTISKIRFLESQGLIDPERTPSGYRKFYKDDVDRLRWILTQQRDNFALTNIETDALHDVAFAVIGVQIPDRAVCTLTALRHLRRDARRFAVEMKLRLALFFDQKNQSSEDG